ncbi:MAG: FtsW/RodA/SpoVE family cell cycle protein [Fusobacteriaceae bacterium]
MKFYFKNYLPEIHTDFIIISFGEEKGFIGLLFIIFLFWWLFEKLKDIALNCNDSFGKYLVMGVTTLIYYGGTSFITLFIGIGLTLNVNKNY